MENPFCVSGILPYAKPYGITSFASLNIVKKTLGTKKIGHTGTLDKFAEGLLVVLSGSLTRLVPFFTLFDKTYEALIAFGEETDTLDLYGSVVKTAPLPDILSFERACASFCGNLMQTPPAYSAVHVNGKRASDLARAGQKPELAARSISVYRSTIIEKRLCAQNRVSYARVLFSVSKGTYIRSLVRDIARACGSAAHLIGLKRTKVGCFDLEAAVWADKLEPFTIDMVTERVRRIQKNADEQCSEPECTECTERERTEKNAYGGSTSAVLNGVLNFERSTALQCGFGILELRKKYRFDFFNGKPLKSDFFENYEQAVCQAAKHTQDKIFFAVFLPDGTFGGIIQSTPCAAPKLYASCAADSSGKIGIKLTYGFVVAHR